MKSMDSAITGALSQVQRAASSTGPRHGETASGTLPAVSASELRARLLRREPEDNDRELRHSLTSSLNVVFESEGRWMFPKNKPPYKQIDREIVTGSPEAIRTAVRLVREAMEPPTQTQVEEWLAMLQVATAGGRRSELDSTLQLRVYASALASFPADVVKAACGRLARTEEWFPSLAKLIAKCKELSATRQELADRLRKAA